VHLALVHKIFAVTVASYVKTSHSRVLNIKTATRLAYSLFTISPRRRGTRAQVFSVNRVAWSWSCENVHIYRDTAHVGWRHLHRDTKLSSGQVFSIAYGRSWCRLSWQTVHSRVVNLEGWYSYNAVKACMGSVAKPALIFILALDGEDWLASHYNPGKEPTASTA
jgi:hypothetical protein